MALDMSDEHVGERRGRAADGLGAPDAIDKVHVSGGSSGVTRRSGNRLAALIGKHTVKTVNPPSSSEGVVHQVTVEAGDLAAVGVRGEGVAEVLGTKFADPLVVLIFVI